MKMMKTVRKVFRVIPALLVFFMFLKNLNASDTIPSHIKIRLFSGRETDIIFFSAVSGEYSAEIYPGGSFRIKAGSTAVITGYNGRLALKTEGEKALLSDSVIFKGITGFDRFILSNNDRTIFKYSGDFSCYPDLGTIKLVNNCDIEEYIAGVVKAEGGNGKKEEYFKTQAVIARTYTYRYMGKHLADGYNLCDATHCQVFNGITDDDMIKNAVQHTAGMVIVTPDSNLIISAFHSNCGGETSPSEYVWLTSLPYLSGVKDPYCTGSKNAAWEKKISLDEWKNTLAANGYKGNSDDPRKFVFSQPSRMMNYTADSFSIPFNVLRTSLGLRSAWFSVFADGDSLLLRGRGYGHGVGLCQEGAMVMAGRGMKYEEIIKFYYSGVELINIAYAKKVKELKK